MECNGEPYGTAVSANMSKRLIQLTNFLTNTSYASAHCHLSE